MSFSPDMSTTYGRLRNAARGRDFGSGALLRAGKIPA
jgi:hypothetical protein